MTLAWVTFPAGGVYPWVWVPAGCAAAVLAWCVRPRIAAGASRTSDIVLMLAICAMAAQLVPLPSSLGAALDPHALDVRAALWLPPQPAAANLLPITLVPAHTLAALGISISALLMFWTCRGLFEAGGLGRIVRAMAVIGLVGSVAAIVQRGQSEELIYGIWRPVDAGARPYGPFVNRNHFATWIVMAAPLIFGYLLARAPGQRRADQFAQRLVAALKQIGSVRVWLVASIGVMTVALLVSASRSGLLGLLCAATVGALLRKGAAGPAVRRWILLQAAVLVAVAVSFANFDVLMDRFDQTLRPSDAGRGRTAIWADAWRMTRDFALTGTGAGTFGSAIAVYQTAEPGYSIGNAHNHYLQLAAEGGVLIGLPAALSIGAFAALAWRRMREDDSPNYFVRAGAVAGIAGALLQSVWETGLRMPANAMLLAVLAAAATHAPGVRAARGD